MRPLATNYVSGIAATGRSSVTTRLFPLYRAGCHCYGRLVEEKSKPISDIKADLKHQLAVRGGGC